MSYYAEPFSGQVARALEAYKRVDPDPAFTFFLLLLVCLFVMTPLTFTVSVWFGLGFLSPLVYAGIWIASNNKLHDIRYSVVYINSKESFGRLQDPSLQSIARPLLQEVWNHSLHHGDNYCKYCINRAELIKDLVPDQAMESSAVQFAREFLSMQKEIAS